MKTMIKLSQIFVLTALFACNSVNSPAPEATGDDQLARLGKPQPISEASLAAARAQIEKMEQRAAEESVVIEKHASDQIATQSSKITVPDDYPTIQAAINAAKRGTKIKVKTGDYYEVLSITKNNLEITAEGEVNLYGAVYYTGVTGGSINNFFIDGDVLGVSVTRSEEIEIEDNRFADTRFAVFLQRSNNCTIKGNSGENCESGVYLQEHSNNNRIEENTFDDCDYPIYLTLDSHENEISGNVLTNVGVIGVSLWFDCESNEIADNEINDSPAAYGVYLVLSDNNEIGSDNQTSNNLYGVFVDRADGNLVKKNEAYGNI